MIDRLRIGRGVGLRRLVFRHALLERLDALSDVTHQLGDLAASEQQQDHGDHHDPVPDTHGTHRKSSATPAECRPLGVGPNLGVEACKNKNGERGKYRPRRSWLTCSTYYRT